MAGAGYRLFNTGDVLTAQQVNEYLQQQVIMRFADSAARTAALSGVLAEGMASWLDDTNSFEVYNGSAWVSASGDLTGLTAGTGITITDPTGPVPTITNDVATEFDTKGDLIVGTGADTFDKLVAGGNGETLVADSSTSTGLRYNPTTAAGKNVCINGAFDIWQRGTTFTNPSSAGIYTADRWTVYFNGNGTVTQETSVKPDTSTYALKVSATASSAGNDVYQLVEQLNMEQFRGKVVTLSVKVAGTATLAPAIALAYSTTANDTLINTSTAITATIVANPTINASTFVTYISQFTVPTTAKTLRIQLGSGTMANTNVLYWAEAQLELGLVATAFSRAGGTLAGELAACQRYYYRNTGSAASLYALFVPAGYFNSTTVFNANVLFPTLMRTAPTSVDFANLTVQDNTAALLAITAVTVDGNTDTPYGVALVCTVAGATVDRTGRVLGNNSATAHLGFSAEL